MSSLYQFVPEPRMGNRIPSLFFIHEGGAALIIEKFNPKENGLLYEIKAIESKDYSNWKHNVYHIQTSQAVQVMPVFIVSPFENGRVWGDKYSSWSQAARRYGVTETTMRSIICDSFGENTVKCLDRLYKKKLKLTKERQKKACSILRAS